jgi:hypothetical protein
VGDLNWKIIDVPELNPFLRSILFALFLLALFALVLAQAHYYPYFPPQYDDADYWIDSYRILNAFRDSPHWSGKISALYFLRRTKPFFFPLFGFPFLLSGMHVALATALINGICFTLLAWILYRIFRLLEFSRAFALAACAFLVLQSPVFASATRYLSELPCLVFLSAAYLARLRNRPWVSGVLLGLALCLRPVESAVLVLVLLCGELMMKERSGLWRFWRCALGTAAAIAFAWYLPFLPQLKDWVLGAIFNEMKAGGVSERMPRLLRSLFSPWLLALAPLAMAAEYKYRKSFRLSAFGVAAFAIPFVIALQAGNVTSVGEPRRYLGFLLLSGGIFLTQLRGRAGALLGVLLLLQLYWFGAEWAPDVTIRQSQLGITANPGCSELVRTAETLHPPEGARIFFLVARPDYTIAPCTLSTAMAGRKWEMVFEPIFILPAVDAQLIHKPDLLLDAPLVGKALRAGFDYVIYDGAFRSLLSTQSGSAEVTKRVNLARSLAKLQDRKLFPEVELGNGFRALKTR